MYCTVQDVRNVLAPYGTNPNQTPASVGERQMTDSILEAQDTVNTYVLARYTITLHEVEQIDDDEVMQLVMVAWAPIQNITRDIAAYLTMLVWRKNQDVSVRDPIYLRYLQAMKMLQDIRDGKTNLPIPPFQPPGQVTDDAMIVVNTYTGRLFGPEDFDLTPSCGDWGPYYRRSHGW